MIKNYFIALLIAISSFYVKAQTYLISTTSSVTTCSGTIYDSGGSSGNYGNSENNSMVVYSATAGLQVQLTISYDIESDYDYLKIYNGTDATASLLANISGSGSITVTGNNASAALYLVFTSDGTVTYPGFTATISCVSPPTPTVNDCLGARPVCSGHYDETDPTAGSNNGMGNYANEIYDSGFDCNSDESSGIWYVFTVQTTGAFQFTITPDDALSDDYDWILFDATNYTCADYVSLSGRDAAKVSSNTAGSSVNHGPTGINTANSTAHDNCGGPDTDHGNQWNDDIIVNAGEQYLLYVENWSQLPSGYQIDFTSNIVDTQAPALDQITSSPSCGQNQITFMFTERVLCSSVTSADFTVTGPAGELYSVTAINCNSGATYSEDFTITLNANLTSGGTYTLNMIGQVDDACNNTTNPTSLNFTVSGVSATASVTQNVQCYGGADGTAIASGSGGTAPYTYNWSGGAGSSATATGLSATTYTVTVTDANLVCNSVQTITVTQPTQITSSFSQTNVNCNGESNGSATVNPTNGTPAYTYAWDAAAGSGTSATASSLSAGTYTVSVYDTHSCLHTNSVTITQPTPYAVDSFQLIEPQCNGGSDGQIVIHNLTGASPPYSVLWSDGQTGTQATGLTAGNYTGTITDSHGCTLYNDVSNPFVLGEPSAISVSSTPDDANCYGGSDASIALNSTGGTPGYTYQWDAAASGQTASTAIGLTAGSYNVTVTDSHSCTSLNLFSVGQASQIVITQGTINDAHCGNSDGSGTVSATGGTGTLTYTWNTTPTQTGQTVSNVQSGSYIVSVSDANSCLNTLTISIADVGAPSISLISSADVQCYGGNDGTATVLASGGTGTLNYSWSSSSNTGTTETGLIAGNYTASVTDGAGCVSTVNLSISEPTQLNAIISSNISATCNTYTDGSATVDVSGGTTSYSYLWDSNAGSQTNATASNIGAGNYTVTVTDAHNCTTTANVTVAEPSAVSIDATDSTKPLCFGDANGTASVITVSGGTSASGTYTYSWNTTPVQTGSQATGLLAGTYNVTVYDDNSCEATTSINIAQQTLLTASVTGTDPLCNSGTDGNATVVGSGGTITTDYSYLWDNNANDQTTATASNLSLGAYSVTITDDNSCTAVTNVTLSQPTAINTNITLQNVSCFGGNDAYAIVTATDGTPGYTYSWTGGSTLDSIGGLSAGWYFVTVLDNNLCPKYDSVLISEPTLLTVSGSSIDVLCNGGNDGQANLIVNGGTTPYTYNWTNGDINQNIVDSAGTYTVTVTDNLSCTETTTITINEPDTISVTMTVNDPHCGNADGDASVTPSGGVGSYTYLWSSNVGSDTTSSSVNSLIAGPYAVTVYDGNNCEYTEYINLSDIGSATIDVVNIVNNQCFNDSLGSAEASIISGGTAPFNYTWVDTSGVIQTGLSATIDSIPAGTYSLVVDDFNGCTSSLGFTIEQNAQLGALMSLDSAILCFGDTNGIIIVTPLGGTAPYNYFWSHDSNLSDSIAINLGAGTYDVTVIDDSLCAKVKHYTINDPALLTVSLDTSINVSCFGGNNGEISVMPGGGTPNYNYIWDNGSTAPLSDSLYSGYHTVTLTDNNNCFVIDSFEITQPTAITATLSSINSICGGSTGSLTINANGGTSPYNYAWAHDTLLINNTADNLSQGSYYVSVIDSLGCVFDTLGNIVDDGAGTASVSSVSDVLCYGESTGLATIDMTGGTADFTYIISMAGINIDSTTSSNISYSISNLVVGTYDVEVYDANGCLSTTNIIINQPTELIISDSTINIDCYNGNTGSIYVEAFGGIPTYSYVWNTSATDSTLSNLSAGFYSVTVTDFNVCIKTIDSIEITQPTEMVLSLDEIVDLSCNSDSSGSITVSATGGTPNYTYLWSNGETTASITDINAGTYTVTIFDDNLCNDTLIISVNEPSQILLSDTIYSEDYYGVIEITPIGGTPDYTYSWSNGETSNLISGLYAGDYMLTVTDANGCNIENLYIIDIPIIIPTVITPNNDGKNDKFRIVNINAFEKVDIKVFNRWGDIIFDYSGTGIGYEDESKQWDGMYNGNELPIGSFVYIIDLNNDEDPYTGTVTIIR